MKLQRVFVLGLAAALILLSGCGAAQKDADTTATASPTAATTTATVEIITEATTEESTTEKPTEPLRSAGAEPSLRTLDLDDKANAAVKSRLEELEAEKRPSEYSMGNGKTVVEKETGIFLHDDKTKKETVLLESKRDGPNEEWIETPYILQKLDDRYFVYALQGWEWQAGAGIYDIVRMKAIPIEAPQGKSYMDSYHYQTICGDTLFLHGPVYNTSELGPLEVYTVDLSKLDKAETLTPGEDLLKDVPEAKFEELNDECFGSAFSPDGRYCAVQAEQYNRDPHGNGIIAVFDLHQKSFVFQMEKQASMKDYQHMAFDDNNTLYVYGKTYDDAAQQWEFAREVLEIKLP